MPAPMKRRAVTLVTAAAPKAPSEPLHIKYRPQLLDDVVGQQGTCTNLAKLFNDQRVPHAFLFTGPAGTGKTTLARIVGRMLGCASMNVLELDAARYSGIDNMRGILDGTQYVSLGASQTKLVICDEAHAFSKATWQTLLKKVEEPEPHLYWAFCTTEAEKVPKTIRTRCHAYNMSPVSPPMLTAYLEDVCKLEGLSISKEFLSMAAQRADGSVRQALVFASMLDGIVQKEQAIKLLETVDDAEEGPVKLARALVKGAGWNELRAIVVELAETPPETTRQVVLGYVRKTLQGANETQAPQLLAVLERFFSATPWMQNEGQASLLYAVGALTLMG